MTEFLIYLDLPGEQEKLITTTIDGNCRFAMTENT